MNFLFFLSLFSFYQYTALSSRTVDGHQMYSEGSVVGKASTIMVYILPTLPLMFTCSQKGRNLAWFSTLLNFKPPAFEHAARYLYAETNYLCRNDRPMSSPSSVKVGPRTPKNLSVKVPHHLKLHGENVLNRQ